MGIFLKGLNLGPVDGDEYGNQDAALLGSVRKVAERRSGEAKKAEEADRTRARVYER